MIYYIMLLTEAGVITNLNISEYSDQVEKIIICRFMSVEFRLCHQTFLKHLDCSELAGPCRWTVDL